VSIHAGETAIDVAEFAVKFLEDGDIGFLANRQSAKLRAVDFTRGIQGRALDEIVERHAHGAEFGHNLVKTEDGEIPGVQIGGNGIRDEALLDCGDRIAKPEASATVTDIKNHAPVACFGEDGI